MHMLNCQIVKFYHVLGLFVLFSVQYIYAEEILIEDGVNSPDLLCDFIDLLESESFFNNEVEMFVLFVYDILQDSKHQRERDYYCKKIQKVVESSGDRKDFVLESFVRDNIRIKNYSKAIERSFLIEDSELRSSVQERILKESLEFGCYQIIIDFYRENKDYPYNDSSLGIIASAFLKLDDLDVALKILDKINDKSERLVGLIENLTNNQSGSKLISEAKRIVEEEDNLRSEIFRLLRRAEICYLTNDLHTHELLIKKAIDLLESIPSLEVTDEDKMDLYLTCVRTENYYYANILLDRIKQDLLSSQSEEEISWKPVGVAAVFYEKRDWEAFFQIINLLKSEEFSSPKIILLELAISYFVKTGDFHEAKRLLDVMESEVIEVEENSGLTDLTFLMDILQHYAFIHDYRKAYEVIESIEYIDVKMIATARVAAICLHNGHFYGDNKKLFLEKVKSFDVLLK